MVEPRPGSTPPTPVTIAAPRRAVAAPAGPPARLGPVAAAAQTARTLAGEVGLAVNLQVTRRLPVSLVHFVTRRCNARCSFCFIDFDHPAQRHTELTVEEIDRLTRTVGPHLRNVNLTGGEPFLRRDLDRIVDSWYRNTAIESVYITSNGAFPDQVEDLARRVAADHPDRRLIVSFSIDGLPADHDRIRRVSGLFDKTMDSYHRARAAGANVTANIGITVSHENHSAVPELYRHLVEERGIRAVTAIVVRDEGVYAIPEDHRREILAAYRWLTERIGVDLRSGVLEGYDPATLQGRLMNRKNEMLWRIVADTYLEPRYVSPCHAARLFGVIDVDGTVHPCEVLDRPLGNLRDHDMDLGRVWASAAADETAHWIRDTRCHCSYECAWGFNILGNARYQPELLRAAIGR